MCGGCLELKMPSSRAFNPSLNMAPHRPVCLCAAAGPYCHRPGGCVQEDAHWQVASVPPRASAQQSELGLTLQVCGKWYHHDSWHQNLLVLLLYHQRLFGWEKIDFFSVYGFFFALQITSCCTTFWLLDFEASGGCVGGRGRSQGASVGKGTLTHSVFY